MGEVLGIASAMKGLLACMQAVQRDAVSAAAWRGITKNSGALNATLPTLAVHTAGLYARQCIASAPTLYYNFTIALSPDVE